MEYSADLLLVLKYRTDADRENKTAPRHLALNILKNRFGATGESVPLDYEPEKELFRDAPPRQPRAQEETLYGKAGGRYYVIMT